jgi:chromosome segregation ATPase
VLSPQLSDKWHQFAANIALHEQTHVDIVLATLKEFAEVAPNSAPNCNQLESRIENSWDLTVELIDEQQEEFHADELTRLNAAMAPLQSQLADAETELARLDNELDAFNAQIDRLASQIHITESLYGRNGAPAGIYNEYKRTINRHNALIHESDAVVINYNGVLARVNRIIEELNWVQ